MKSNISAPALRRHRHSLVDAGNVVDPGDDRWVDGVNFTPRGCNVLYGHDTKCWVTRGDKNLQGCSPLAVFYPYVIEATLAWSTVDLGADPKAILNEALEVGTSAVLERLIEMPLVNVSGAFAAVPVSGTISTVGISGRAATPAITNPHLANGYLVSQTAGGAVVSSLEAKMLDASDHIGGAGVIYTSPFNLDTMRDALDVRSDGLYTLATGSRVVVGNFSPDFVYGHVGDVDVYLSPTGDITEVVERETNELILQVERFAVAVWNPCAAFKIATG